MAEALFGVYKKIGDVQQSICALTFCLKGCSLCGIVHSPNWLAAIEDQWKLFQFFTGSEASKMVVKLGFAYCYNFVGKDKKAKEILQELCKWASENQKETEEFPLPFVLGDVSRADLLQGVGLLDDEKFQ